MLGLMEERIYKVEELKDYTKQELRELRNEISDRIHWRLTTENYDKQKIQKLTSNENKISKLLLK